MKTLSGKTIQRRIIIPTLFLTVLSFTALGVVLVFNTYSVVVSAMEPKIGSAANLLAKISAPYIATRNYPPLEGFVQEATKDPDVEYLVFYDSQGHPITKMEEKTEATASLIIYEGQIMDLSGAVIGTLKIGYKKKSLIQTMVGSISRTVISVLVVMAVMATMLTLIGRRVAGFLTRITWRLTEGVDQGASASRQVSSSAQSLAEGASEQASLLKETLSSLEEISSMTRRNTDAACRAKGQMDESALARQRVNSSWDQLEASIGEMVAAIEEASHIIKTIDEIAFKTNLLALNAAVEAARAGEAGSGFAEVADEVRNLARLSAEAAKETTSLIESAIKKAKEMSGSVSRTNDFRSQVATSYRKVAELLSEIAVASKEQALGIDQFNQAVARMNKVARQNAIVAKESASASEKLSFQIEAMENVVGELAVLVNAR